MYRLINLRNLAALGLLAGFISGSAGTALSRAAVTNTAATGQTATDIQQQQQQRLADIKTKGDAEIARRLAQLAKLNGLITSAKKLSTSDRATLTSQVSSEVTGLTTLKAQLDAETTYAAAVTDAKSIFNDYRVYALITPKVHLVKVADDQQVNEADLAALATKLQSRITTAQAQGKSVTALQTALTDMNAKVKAAQGISGTVEAAVINLQPSDFNSNHTVLSGDAAQLQAAHADNQAAYQDAATIVAGLKAL